eukprot:375915_1
MAQEEKKSEIKHIPNGLSYKQNNMEKTLYPKKLGDRKHKVITAKDKRAIIQCIGRIVTKWDDDLYGYGTGTVFAGHAQQTYIITCAHNIVEYDEGEIVKPKEIWFERRETFANKDSVLTKKYKALVAWAHEKYSFRDQCPFDMAVISIYTPTAPFYTQVMEQNKQWLGYLAKIPQNVAPNYGIYGYPFKRNSTVRGGGELWGMESKSYSKIIGKEMYIRKSQDNSLFFYNAIDTEPGQSGAPIFIPGYGDKHPIVVGIHTGGSKAKEKNWGIVLDEYKKKWMHAFSDDEEESCIYVGFHK